MKESVLSKFDSETVIVVAALSINPKDIIQSSEDPNVYYIPLPNGRRIIVEDGKMKGWYTND